MKQSIHLVLALVLCVVSASTLGIGPDSAATQVPTLKEHRVVRMLTKQYPPFVDCSNPHAPKGLSISMWEDGVAEPNLWHTEWTCVETVHEAETRLAEGGYDGAVAAFSNSEARRSVFEFSAPYYTQSPDLLVPLKNGGFWEFRTVRLVAATLWSPEFAGVFLLVYAAMVVVGHCYYWFEHGQGAVRSKYLAGLDDSVWGAFAVFTTIGWGDIVLKRFRSRLLTYLVAPIGFVLIGTITGSIASALTVDAFQRAISEPEDLRGKPVAVIEGTSTHGFFRARYGIEEVPVENMQAALAELKQGNVKAVGYDRAAFDHLLKTIGSGRYALLGKNLRAEHFVVLLPRNSKLRRDVDLALLRFTRSPEFSTLCENYLGKSCN